MSENTLKEIPFDSLESLRELYQQSWPEHVVAYNFLGFMIRKIEKFEGYRELTNIYSINGEVNEDATFVGFILNKHMFIATATLDKSFEELKKLLKLIDFNIPRMFLCARQIYRNFLLDFIASDNSLKVSIDDETIMVHMRKEEALKFEYEVPKGFELRSLSIKDADFVQSTWTFASRMNENFVEYTIKYNPSVALYDENNELVAWCLVFDFGTLLHLFTIPSHRNKGYAEIITKAISKKIAEIGCDVATSIVTDNLVSFNLFTKLGFKEIDRNFWIGIERKDVI